MTIEICRFFTLSFRLSLLVHAGMNKLTLRPPKVPSEQHLTSENEYACNVHQVTYFK